MKWACLDVCHPVEEYIPGIRRCLVCHRRWFHMFIFNWDGWDR